MNTQEGEGGGEWSTERANNKEAEWDWDPERANKKRRRGLGPK
jgi:hypothetical protein